MWRTCGPVTASATRTPKTPSAATAAGVRNCRQASQVMASSGSWRRPGHGEGIVADRSLPHVGEDEVFEVDRLDDPPGLDDRAVTSNHEQSLAVGDRGRDDRLV